MQKYTNQGYSIDYVKKFLIQSGVLEKDIDEAIQYLNSQNSINSSNNLNSPNPNNNALELQIRNYFQTQIRNGYTVEIIRTGLIKQGFDKNIVDKIANENSGVNINVNHEVNFSTKTLFTITFAVIILGAVFFGIANLNIFQNNEALLDVTSESSEYSYIAGDIITYQIQITNMGSKNRFDVTAKYLIVDDSENIITRKEETLAVETTTRVSRVIQIPQGVTAGKYYLRTIVDYSGKQAKSSIEFTVLDKTPSEMQNINNNQNTPIKNENINTDSNLKPTPNVEDLDLPSSNIKTTFGDQIEKIIDIANTNPSSALGECKKFTSKEHTDICYNSIASSTNNFVYCNNIESVEYKDNCYLSFVFNGNQNMCSNLNIKENKDFCEQFVIIQQMNYYYEQNNTEKILELSEKFNPELYNSNIQVNSYEDVYNQVIPITSVSLEIIQNNQSNSSN